MLGRPLVAALAVILTSLGEIRVLDRLLFEDPGEYGFVLEALRDLVLGTPVSKSWQHRMLSPYLMRALEVAFPKPLDALEFFLHAMVFAQNALLFALVRKKCSSSASALLAVGAFGLARLLLTYRLEYMWDEIDILIFFSFGFAASRALPLRRLWPLLLVGTFNHETALYIPAWFLLPRDREMDGMPPSRRKEIFGAGVALALMSIVIFLVRKALYVGRPPLPKQVFEVATPVIENHAHVAHNLRQLFFEDWRGGKVFIAASFLAVVSLLVWLVRIGAHRRSASWSLILLASIIVFGYVNETRHYLLLLAFWSTYGFRAKP